MLSIHAIARLVVATCLLGSVCTQLSADDWPQWRGALRDGVWRETGLTNDLPEGQIPLEWSIPLGAGYAGPTVAEGRVYVMDRATSEDGSTQNERVLCVSSKDGQKIDRHKRWQVLVLAAQTKRNPRTKGRSYKVGRATMQKQCRWAVSNTLGVHRMNHAHLIDMLGHLGKQIGDPTTCLTVLLESPRRLHNAMRAGSLSGLGQYTVVIKRQRLAVALSEKRFVVE